MAIESLVIIAAVVAPLRELYGRSRGSIVLDRNCGNYQVDTYARPWARDELRLFGARELSVGRQIGSSEGNVIKTKLSPLMIR